MSIIELKNGKNNNNSKMYVKIMKIEAENTHPQALCVPLYLFTRVVTARIFLLTPFGEVFNSESCYARANVA